MSGEVCPIDFATGGILRFYVALVKWLTLQCLGYEEKILAAMEDVGIQKCM